MAQLDLENVTTLVAVAVMFTLVIGYARTIAEAKGAVFHLSASIVLVFFSYVLRTSYWSLYGGTGAAPVPHDIINPLFDALAIWGGMHGHCAIYLMIPEADRKDWSAATAWAYPPIMIRGACRRTFGWFRR